MSAGECAFERGRPTHVDLLRAWRRRSGKTVDELSRSRHDASDSSCNESRDTNGRPGGSSMLSCATLCDRTNWYRGHPFQDGPGCQSGKHGSESRLSSRSRLRFWTRWMRLTALDLQVRDQCVRSPFVCRPRADEIIESVLKACRERTE